MNKKNIIRYESFSCSYRPSPPSWFEWLVGVFDAEGGFTVTFEEKKRGPGNQKTFSHFYCRYFVSISFAYDRDIKLICDIQARLNLGKIYAYPFPNSRNEAKWVISSREEILQFLELFDKYPYLQNKRQKENYKKLRFGILQNIRNVESKEQLDSLCNDYSIKNPFEFILFENFTKNFKFSFYQEYTDTAEEEKLRRIVENWISGFMTGEACFYLPFKNNELRKEQVCQIEQGDSKVLHIISDYFCFQVKPRDKKVEENESEISSLYVSALLDIRKIIHFFNRKEPFWTLRGFKKIQFVEWYNYYQKREPLKQKGEVFQKFMNNNFEELVSEMLEELPEPPPLIEKVPKSKKK